jgi:CBS-domain-containing membrane protein
MATATGLAVATLLGASPFARALAVGLSITLMLATRTTHAPAGFDPLLVMLATPD